MLPLAASTVGPEQIPLKTSWKPVEPCIPQECALRVDARHRTRSRAMVTRARTRDRASSSLRNRLRHGRPGCYCPRRGV